ncbi:hypothetical protein [Dactylosporangium darangshiense]|uniref:hypothetical protein n=1 Tax=Dactylosporangium darangshiense TaxID=579108 RepID=UPI0031EADCA9
MRPAAAAHVEWGPVAVWVGALISSLAVIVALLGGMGWFARRRQPILSLTFEPEQPWCRRVGRHDGDTGVPDALWVRIAVENHGKSPAYGCIGRLVGLNTDEALRSDIDPVQLRWAGVPRSRSFEPVDIRPGQREYLNVAYRPSGGHWVIDTFDDDDFEPGFPIRLPADQRHVLTVALFTDNAHTRSIGLRIEEGTNGPRLSREP